jgi:hypothetical protein
MRMSCRRYRGAGADDADGGAIDCCGADVGGAGSL